MGLELRVYLPTYYKLKEIILERTRLKGLMRQEKRFILTGQNILTIQTRLCKSFVMRNVLITNNI